MRRWVLFGARVLAAAAVGALPAAGSASAQAGPAVYVLGGPDAVDQAVLQAVHELVGVRPVRLSGSDRHATAAAISRAHFASAPALLVASGESYADSLSAGPAAAALGGPILLVTRDGVPPATDAELRRLAPRRVVIAGGPHAVGRAVEAQLAAMGMAVQRVSGPDRYATSAALSRLAAPSGANTVLLASGRDFPDAMSAAAPAAVHRASILLTDPGGVSPAVRAELLRLSPDEIVVVGGETAVPARLADQLRAETGIPYRRVAGPDRFVTTTAMSRAFYPAGADAVFLSNASRFADAMVVGAVARGGAAGAAHPHDAGRDSTDGVLLYTHRSGLPPLVRQELARLAAERRAHRPKQHESASPSPSPSPSQWSPPSPGTAPAPPAPAPNAPPAVDMDGGAAGEDTTANFTEDGAAVLIAPAAIVTAADSANLTGATVTLTNRPDGAAESLTITAALPAGISAGGYDATTGVLSLSGTSSLVDYQAALRLIGYRNGDDSPTTATLRSVTVTVTDGAASSTARTSTVSVTAVNDAPSAADHRYTDEPVFVNVLFASGAGAPVAGSEAQTAHTLALLDDATDADNDALTLTGLVVTAGQGTATILDAATGAFSYEPTTSGEHVLTYTVSDGGLTDTGTVTIDVDPDTVVFVKSGAAGSGSSTDPAGTLADAQAAAAAGDTIFVSAGDGSPYTGGIAMETGQRLIGRPSGLTLSHSGGSVAVVTANATAKPVVGNAAGPAITMADGTTVDGVAVTQTAQPGITGGAGTATIANVAVTTTTGNGVDLDTGAYTLSGGVTITSTTGTALEQTSGAITVSGSGNTLRAAGGRALHLTGTAVSGGMAFESISTDGGANGITFSPSNGDASLTVHGLSDDTSGGSIADHSGDAIVATAGSLALSKMLIQANQGRAISAAGTRGLTLHTVAVGGNGDAAAEHSVQLTNVTGTNSVADSTFSDGSGDLLRLSNTNANATLTITNSTFRDLDATGGARGLAVYADGSSAIIAMVTGSTFRDLNGPGALFATGTLSGGTGASSLTFRGNTMTGANLRPTHLEVLPAGQTTATVMVGGPDLAHANTFTTTAEALRGAVTVKPAGAATVRATVRRNTVDGSRGYGVLVVNEGGNPTRVLVRDNTVTNPHAEGIWVGNAASAAANPLDATILGNAVSGAGTGEAATVAAIRFEAFDDTVCSDISGNTLSQTTNGVDISLDTRNGAGHAYVMADAAPVTDAKVAARNNGAVVSILNAAPGKHGGAACLQP